jgi:hypothetical protein
MKLPVLDTFSFPVVLPSTGEQLTIRPFLVREEKLLLLAQESQNYTEQVEAIAQVIRNCTNGKVEPKKIPYFDVEYLLVQLRTRSVGEIVTPLYVCHHTPVGAQDECGHKTPVPIDLRDVQVQNLIENNPAMSIALTDRYVLTLRYPTVYTVQKMITSLNGTTTTNPSPKAVAEVVDAMVDVFESLTDTQTETVYKFDNFGKQEKTEFLNSLTTQQYEKVTQFVSNMPSVELEKRYTCERCQFEHTINLKGLADFLG